MSLLYGQYWKGPPFSIPSSLQTFQLSQDLSDLSVWLFSVFAPRCCYTFLTGVLSPARAILLCVGSCLLFCMGTQAAISFAILLMSLQDYFCCLQNSKPAIICFQHFKDIILLSLAFTVSVEKFANCVIVAPLQQCVVLLCLCLRLFLCFCFLLF